MRESRSLLPDSMTAVGRTSKQQTTVVGCSRTSDGELRRRDESQGRERPTQVFVRIHRLTGDDNSGAEQQRGGELAVLVGW